MDYSQVQDTLKKARKLSKESSITVEEAFNLLRVPMAQMVPIPTMATTRPSDDLKILSEIKDPWILKETVNILYKDTLLYEQAGGRVANIEYAISLATDRVLEEKRAFEESRRASEEAQRAFDESRRTSEESLKVPVNDSPISRKQKIRDSWLQKINKLE
jgi:hypothetical protein